MSLQMTFFPFWKTPQIYPINYPDNHVERENTRLKFIG